MDELPSLTSFTLLLLVARLVLRWPLLDLLVLAAQTLIRPCLAIFGQRPLLVLTYPRRRRLQFQFR